MKENHSNTVLVSNGLPDFALAELEKLEKTYVKPKSTLELDHIDKVYENGFQAIFGTSLTLEKGEFLALLGPSGCGKSTTLRMIAGLETVTEGEININDIQATHSEPSDRNLTMVFQNYALFPHLSVKNNIAFGLKANKKKLGEGGKIYSKMLQVNNEIATFKKKIADIKDLPTLEKRIISLEAKAVKKTANLEKAKQEQKEALAEADSSSNSKNIEKVITKYEKLVGSMHLDHKKIMAAIASGKRRFDRVSAEANQIGKFQNKIEVLKEKHKGMEEKRKLAAEGDDHSQIIEEKVENASKTLGLEYYLDRKPAALSGGQRQRVALGRSIVGNPTLFLMDEPLSNLDAKLRASMRRQIRELHEKINSATVYVTHDQVEAMTMADKIAVMSDGFVMQIGSPKDVYKNPSNIFVASFVGLPSMNMYSGSLKGGVFVSDEGLKIKLPKSKLNKTSNGQRIVLGIRPTDVSVDSDVKAAYKSEIKVKVIAKELLGNTIQYTGEVDNSKEEITFILSSYEDREIGSIIKINPLVSRIHLFDEKTTISLTSSFNLETLRSLKNWSLSGEAIEVRRKILEDGKRKSEKKSMIQKLKLKHKAAKDKKKKLSK